MWRHRTTYRRSRKVRTHARYCVYALNKATIGRVRSTKRREYWRSIDSDAAIKTTVRLLSAGVNLPDGIDLISMLISPKAFKYLQGICCSLNLPEIDRLDLPDFWLVVSLARLNPLFYAPVFREMGRFSPVTLQRFRDINQQVKEINASCAEIRSEFILSISGGGTAEILEPLLAAGMDLGYQATHYFRCSIKQGNVDTANILLNHGAQIDLDIVANFVIHHLEKLMGQEALAGSLLRLVEQMLTAIGPLQQLDPGHTIFRGLISSLAKAAVLSEPNRTWHNTSDNCHTCLKIMKMLLSSGLIREGRLPRRIGEVLVDKYGGWAGSALVLAVDLQNLPVLQLLLEYDYDVEETDDTGSGTPIMFAVKLGLVDHVAALLASGADIFKTSSQGRKVHEIATLCTAERHPRIAWPRTKRSWCRWPDPEIVQESEDRQILAMLLASVNIDRGLKCRDARGFLRFKPSGNLSVSLRLDLLLIFFEIEKGGQMPALTKTILYGNGIPGWNIAKIAI